MKICTNNIILTTAQYVCDALGRRVRKTSYDAVPSVATLYYYSDNWQVLAEYNGSGVQQAYYIFGNYIDEVLLMNRGGADKYYLHDHLYSPVALLNASSNVLERCEYDAYGKVTVWNAAFTTTYTTSQYGNPYYFTGRERDTLDNNTLHLMYYRARTYDTDTGRFMQRDPLGVNPAGGIYNPFYVIGQYDDGVNIYEYVKSTPIIYSDPQGYITDQELTQKYTKTEWDKQANCIDTVHVYGHGYQKDHNAYIGDGKHETPFRPKAHMPSGPYCCVIKVWLRMCYVGRGATNLERIAQSIARSNPGKWVYVCGCDDLYMESWLFPKSIGWCEGRWVCVSAKR